MAKRALKRKPYSNRSKELDDYWNNIGTSLGEKLELQDVSDVPDRTITVGKKNTSWRKITSDLQDTANNTSQFVKIINAHLKDKKLHIKRIIELADNFEKEIQQLKSDTAKIAQLSETSMHEFKSDKLRKIAQELLKDRERRQAILKKLKSDIIIAEEELHKSNKRIEAINDEILEKCL